MKRTLCKLHTYKQNEQQSVFAATDVQTAVANTVHVRKTKVDVFNLINPSIEN